MASKEMEHNHSEDSSVKFVCPNCGEVERDDVAFLCNTCEGNQMINKSGVYMCPTCLEPGENFECMVCESTEVEMTEK